MNNEINNYDINNYSNSVFIKIKEKTKANNYCFNCNIKEPKWVNIENGTFICSKCAGKERNLDNNYTILSIIFDQFSQNQIKRLIVGGNQELIDYLYLNDEIKENYYFHSCEALKNYRKELDEKCKNLII